MLPKFKRTHGIFDINPPRGIDLIFCIIVNIKPSLSIYLSIRGFLVVQWLKVIYKALCFDVAQGRMNGAPNETRTHSCRFASLAC